MATVVGVVIGLGVLLFLLATIGRRAASRDLGTVSRVWIIENRAGERDERG